VARREKGWKLKKENSMCDFLSWIEKDKKLFYLTADQIYNTPQGEILRKQVGSNNAEDFYGHEAIRKYYGDFTGGDEKGCRDFSTPDKFPKVIIKAIKRGDFRGLANPEGLLTASAYKAYSKAIASAYKAHNEVTASAYKAYSKAIASAFWGSFAKLKNRNLLWR
jgi:hypothetical protein